MASAKDIFNNKFKSEDLIGKDSFFNNLEEVSEFSKKQQRFLPKINYYDPFEFAKFGSAEEYYKNAINYINNEYPYDACTSKKLNWINSLNDFEYHLFLNEFPRSTGHVFLGTNQKIVISSSVDTYDYEPKEAYEDKKRNYIHNTINFNSGFVYEGWFKFAGEADLLTINAVTASAGVLQSKTLLKIKRNTSDNFSLLIDAFGTSSTNLTVSNDQWNHLAFNVDYQYFNVFLNGQLQEKISISGMPLVNDTYLFGPLGLMYQKVADLQPNTTNFYQIPPFVIGDGQNVSIDELRFWNGNRSIEKIGRYWFTNVDGNDFNDVNNSNLCFYYKFNEGVDDDYLKLCIDYSGNDRHGEIINYNSLCRSNDSGINLSGLVEDVEKPDLVIKGLSYSSTVQQFYNSKMLSGKARDEENIHLLYNKFPGWVLEQEEGQDPQHLRQIIQIISSYFDDLYHKIGEMTNYKTQEYIKDKSNIYPFYDKILTSMGFDVTDLFTNLNIVEKISSRNDINLFDEDLIKIKNGIFQNIYSNLSYILKSKGTEKSIKSFLRSYGVDENLIKINLYADNSHFDVKEKTSQTVVRKKTLTMTGSNVVFSSSPEVFFETQDNNYYTLEVATSFPNKLASISPVTSSIFGFSNSDASGDYNINSLNTNYKYFVCLEDHGKLGAKFILSGSTGYVTSSYIKNIYDDSIWNLCLRKKITQDTEFGYSGSFTHTLELYGVNNNSINPTEFSCSLPYTASNGYFRHYIGAQNIPYNSFSTIYKSNSKFFYCNFWNNYLSNDVISSHNKDVLNYGVDE